MTLSAEVATECLSLLFYIEPRVYNTLDRTKSRLQKAVRKTFKNVRSLVGVVIRNRLILVGVVICYRPTQRARQCSVWIQSSWRMSNSYNKQVSESLNTRLKPRLEGKQRSIDHHHHGCINVDNTVVPTKPNQPHPLPNLCIVNNCRTNFRT